LGVLGDWDHPYTTMAYANEANEIRELGKLLLKGYLYRGLKPVNWCFDCQSALAEAEVEYEDRQDIAIDVAFAVDDADRGTLARAFGLDALPDGPASAVIWTTTPWTIPANQALNVHPEFNYALVQTPRGALIAELDAEALAQEALQIVSGDGPAPARRAWRALYRALGMHTCTPCLHVSGSLHGDLLTRKGTALATKCSPERWLGARVAPWPRHRPLNRGRGAITTSRAPAQSRPPGRRQRRAQPRRHGRDHLLGSSMSVCLISIRVVRTQT
jgi:hypothetical protein